MSLQKAAQGGGGFTLLELTLVFLIMALGVSMTIPSFISFKKDRDLKTGAQITAGAINYARSLAVTTGRRTRLTPFRTRFQLFVEENPLTEPGSFIRRRFPVGLTGKMPDRVLIEQVFYPVVRDEDEGEEEETSSSSSSETPQYQTEDEAEEEREKVLLFETDGSTMDTFIYLANGDPEETTGEISDKTHEDIVTVAVVGVIGAPVIVPRYTEEIFEIYETEEDREKKRSETGGGEFDEEDSEE